MKSNAFSKAATEISSGANLPRISPEQILQFSVPLPPLETQRKIVAILDKAEETRRLRAQADELAERLIAYVFLDMFGDPSRNPNSWEVKRIDEVAERITDGEHITPMRTHEGIYLLSARNIQNHKIALKDVDFIGDEEYERISKRIIPQEGDILISCSGTIGRVARVKDNFKFQMVRSVALVRPNNNIIHPIFLEYTFETNFMKNQIEKSVNQSSQANLFQGKIQKLLIPIPPIDLQYKFAHIVDKIESVRTRIEESNSEINDLFSNLTQKAFNGELVS
jgi:type I restriction enzyme S subunit